MKPLQLALLISATLVGGAMILTLNKTNIETSPTADNVSIVDGQQIIEITAKGGYTPRTSTAKAGIPTILRFHTNGTFDCSSSIRIPSMGISKSLPSAGTVDIAIADPKAGPLIGTCSMGMYPFEINFQS
ncbi:hypothetical protein EXS57_00135 [Candidatus Kaiserbacteria bacterium]|nr:hypothetical protein [Candidatus Kaiserbacteria bacterium]